MSQAQCGHTKPLADTDYGFNDHTDCSDIKTAQIFLTTCNFGLRPLYKILPHLRTIEDMNFIFTTKLIEVFVHMLFKSGLLSQTGWENMV